MPASIRAFLWRILHLNHRTKSEATLANELEFHLQMEIEENLRQGMSSEEARRQALTQGPLSAVGRGYSVLTPATVIRPILLLPYSVNHSAPSGPAVIAQGPL